MSLPCARGCDQLHVHVHVVEAAALIEPQRLQPLGPNPTRTRSDPASFITRNSTHGAPLEFLGLSAAGQRIHLIPLRDVADEQYVAYFMTAGIVSAGVSKGVSA